VQVTSLDIRQEREGSTGSLLFRLEAVTETNPREMLV
jgi:hypothetical protein